MPDPHDSSKTKGSDFSVLAIVLTLNEQKHIERCLASLVGLGARVVVVDSGSTDSTRDIAAAMGAKVVQRRFLNYSDQFGWAQRTFARPEEWILRIDADEYLSPGGAERLLELIRNCDENVSAYTLTLRRVFMGRRLNWGGVGGIQMIRLWRGTRGTIENKHMDEHIKVDGLVLSSGEDFFDHNLNSLSWWTQKHNSYASREVVDLLTAASQYKEQEGPGNSFARDVGIKRWIKLNIYRRIGGGIRALLYAVYRYVFMLGFLDGREGFYFHALQGFWYRTLVDAKLLEVVLHRREHNLTLPEAVRDVLGIDLEVVKYPDKV